MIFTPAVIALAALWPGKAAVIPKDTSTTVLTEPIVTQNHTVPASVVNSETEMSSRLRVVYFHSPSCDECQRVKTFLSEITERWGDMITLDSCSVDNITGFKNLLEYEKHYGVTIDAPPAIFVGDKALLGESVIVEQLDYAIEATLSNGITTLKHDLHQPDDLRPGDRSSRRGLSDVDLVVGAYEARHSGNVHVLNVPCHRNSLRRYI